MIRTPLTEALDLALEAITRAELSLAEARARVEAETIEIVDLRTGAVARVLRGDK